MTLASSLLASQLFRGYRARFVPVDFTLPEDGFEPVDYGLEQLWSVIEELLPLGLRGMLGQTSEAREAARDDLFRKAQPYIVRYAMAAGGAGAAPLPAVDVPLVLTAQARMLHKIAAIYQQPMDVRRMTEIAAALGAGFLTRLGLRELLKLAPVPGLGPSVSALYAGASTYALGAAVCEYFSRIRGGASWTWRSFAGCTPRNFSRANTGSPSECGGRPPRRGSSHDPRHREDPRAAALALIVCPTWCCSPPDRFGSCNTGRFFGGPP